MYIMYNICFCIFFSCIRRLPYKIEERLEGDASCSFGVTTMFILEIVLRFGQLYTGAFGLLWCARKDADRPKERFALESNERSFYSPAGIWIPPTLSLMLLAELSQLLSIDFLLSFRCLLKTKKLLRITERDACMNSLHRISFALRIRRVLSS
jgi:hypothetical protein